MTKSLKPIEQQGQGAAIAKPPLQRVLVVQAVLLLIVSASLLLTDDTGIVQAYSVLLGGLVSVGPNAYFTRWAFRHTGAKAAGEVTRSFYRGEAGKFLLTVVMFASVFILVKPLTIQLFFGAYIVMTILGWILALRYLK